MTSIDDLIKEALTEQESEIIKSTEELGYYSLAMGLFSGKLGWVSWVIMLTQSVMFVAGVWAAWRFFGTADVLLAVKWGLSAAVLLLMAGMLKMSLMPQIQADRVLRELKRVELLILHRAGE